MWEGCRVRDWVPGRKQAASWQLETTSWDRTEGDKFQQSTIFPRKYSLVRAPSGWPGLPYVDWVETSGPPDLPRQSFPHCSVGGGSVAELSPATQESWI